MPRVRRYAVVVIWSAGSSHRFDMSRSDAVAVRRYAFAVTQGKRKVGIPKANGHRSATCQSGAEPPHSKLRQTATTNAPLYSLNRFNHPERFVTSVVGFSIFLDVLQTSTRRSASTRSAAFRNRFIISIVGFDVSLISTAQR